MDNGIPILSDVLYTICSIIDLRSLYVLSQTSKYMESIVLSNKTWNFKCANFLIRKGYDQNVDYSNVFFWYQILSNSLYLKYDPTTNYKTRYINMINYYRSNIMNDIGLFDDIYYSRNTKLYDNKLKLLRSVIPSDNVKLLEYALSTESFNDLTYFVKENIIINAYIYKSYSILNFLIYNGYSLGSHFPIKISHQLMKIILDTPIFSEILENTVALKNGYATRCSIEILVSHIPDRAEYQSIPVNKIYHCPTEICDLCLINPDISEILEESELDHIGDREIISNILCDNRVILNWHKG